MKYSHVAKVVIPRYIVEDNVGISNKYRHPTVIAPVQRGLRRLLFGKDGASKIVEFRLIN